MVARVTLVFSLFCLALLWGAGTVAAQTSLGTENLQLTATPAAPGPNATVRFRVTDYSINLKTADIRWYTGNVLSNRGVGMTEWITKTGGLGSSLSVSVIVTTESGETLTKSIVLRPAKIDLFWQADSDVPFFYPGKGLPTTKNNVRIIALPHFEENGQTLDPSSLIYTWSLDFDPSPQASGVGKNIFATKIKDVLGDTTVSVKVSNSDGTVSATKNITIVPQAARVALFVDDPLAGPDFDHPLGNIFSLSGDEVRIRMVGYFFPKTHTSNPGLRYQWSLNGKATVADAKSPDTLTLRREADTAGQALIAASITDSFDSFISAAKSLTISFGAANFQ